MEELDEALDELEGGGGMGSEWSNIWMNISGCGRSHRPRDSLATRSGVAGGA